MAKKIQNNKQRRGQQNDGPKESKEFYEFANELGTQQKQKQQTTKLKK